MKTTQRPYLIYVGVLLWAVLDFLCALFAEIHADEAYYRLYGQFLDWGYFDHPPMVALLTHWSDMLWSGVSSFPWRNLSIRFCTIGLHVVTVLLLWHTLEVRDRGSVRTQLTFLLMAGSMVMFSAYGFITTPDAPLLFFAALFYYLLRRYLRAPSWPLAMGLGVAMAGMVYSKYMAVLVIGLAVLSYPRLLREGKLWVALLLAVVLTLPHLGWQVANDFPSMRYHLVDRSAASYSLLYTLEYLPNQLVVFNPLLYVLMLFFSIRVWREGDADPMHRIAAMTIVGFQIFFMLMTFRGHVEPHWTMVTTLPAVVLLVEDAERECSVWRKGWVRALLVAMVVLVLTARIVLMCNVLPARWGLCGQRAQMEQIHREHGDEVVVFSGSFQQVSLYRFYFDDRAVHHRGPHDRYTQYDLLPQEKLLNGQ